MAGCQKYGRGRGARHLGGRFFGENHSAAAPCHFLHRLCAFYRGQYGDEYQRRTARHPAPPDFSRHCGGGNRRAFRCGFNRRRLLNRPLFALLRRLNQTRNRHVVRNRRGGRFGRHARLHLQWLGNFKRHLGMGLRLFARAYSAFNREPLNRAAWRTLHPKMAD